MGATISKALFTRTSRIQPIELLALGYRCKIAVGMTLDDYKVVLYRNQPDGWVADVPAIEGCYALMPTREEAVTELARVFEMIADEHRAKGLAMPQDNTAIVHA